MNIFPTVPPAPAATPVPTHLTGQSFTQPIVDLFATTLPNLPKAIVVFAVGVLIIRVLSIILARILGLTKLPKGLIKVTIRLLDTVLWMLLIIAILQLMGLSNVAFALSGAFAVLALAFSNGISATVTDTISGLNLARDRHFRIGDRVTVGDHKTEGIIIDLDTRKTRLKDDKGMIHILPNSIIDKNEWILVERAGVVTRTTTPQRARAAAEKLATIRKKRS